MLFVVADLDASRGLYTAALAPLGYAELYVQEDCVSYGAEELDDFTICRGEPVTTAAHVAFSAEGRDAVDAFFAAAVANGATVRGEPGVWTQYSERYYAAFVNDLHQNNVEAVWHAPEPVVDAPRRPAFPDPHGQGTSLGQQAMKTPPVARSRAETCFDPREEEPHACPGRCACYVNHFCWPGCACNHCMHDRTSFASSLIHTH